MVTFGITNATLSYKHGNLESGVFGKSGPSGPSGPLALEGARKSSAPGKRSKNTKKSKIVK